MGQSSVVDAGANQPNVVEAGADAGPNQSSVVDASADAGANQSGLDTGACSGAM